MKRKNKIVTIALLSSMVLSLTGCSEGSQVKVSDSYSILSGSMLEGAIVADVDGTLEVIKSANFRYDSPNIYVGSHTHYLNIGNGELITDTEDSCSILNIRKVKSIEILSSIDNYLTDDELIKASNKELTEEDVAQIVNRINTEQPMELFIKKEK